MMKIGHWNISGKAEKPQESAVSLSTSQKTYSQDSPFACVNMGKVLVAEKRLRHHFRGAAAIFFRRK